MIVLTPLILSCVLFISCNGKGIASQVIFVIQNLNNVFIDMRGVVHIIQYSKIMPCFYSLHDDILNSLFQLVTCCVSYPCMTLHILIHPLFHLCQDNLDLNNRIPATATSSQRAPRELPESSQRAPRELLVCKQNFQVLYYLSIQSISVIKCTYTVNI